MLVLSVGDRVPWQITADLKEIETCYTPLELGDPLVATMTPVVDTPSPDAPFMAHHGEFTITAVGEGITTFVIDWFYEPTGAGGACAVTVVVESAEGVTIDRPELDLLDGETIPITVSNAGGADTRVSTFFADETSVEFDFPVVTRLLQSGGILRVPITYSATNVGSDRGSLVISRGDGMEEILVPLFGMGPPVPSAAVSTLVHDFGETALGWSGTFDIAVNNTAAKGTLELSGIRFSPAADGAFSFGGPEGFCVPPGQSETLQVTYSPVGQGVDAAGLILQTNDPQNQSVVVELSGAGVPAGDCRVSIASPPELRAGERTLLTANLGGAPDSAGIIWTWNVLSDGTVENHGDGTATATCGGFGNFGVEVIASGGGCESPSSAQLIISCRLPESGGQIPGDCNQDGALDVSDAICLLGFLFLGRPAALACGDGSRRDPANVSVLDFNGDGEIDLSDALASLVSQFLGGPPHVLGRECIGVAGCGGVCMEGGGQRDPEPVISLGDGPFTGGLVVVEEASGMADGVESVRLSYLDIDHWVDLGVDSGLDPDTSTHRGRWVFRWDIDDLLPGTYSVRAEMHGVNGDVGTDEREVLVARRPVGEVLIDSADANTIQLSTAAFVFPGEELLHEWTFDSGAQFFGASVSIPNIGNSFPVFFTHAATNQLGASFSNVYLLDAGLGGVVLLSLAGLSVTVTLGLWENFLLEIVDEKEDLSERLSPENRGHVDSANEKLREAAKKVREAKEKLRQDPPDQAGAKGLLQEAARLIREAIAALGQVDEEESAIQENIRKLRHLVCAAGVSEIEKVPAATGALLESDYLLDRLSELHGVIDEKRGLEGLSESDAQVRDELVALLEEAKRLLREAKRALRSSPPNLAGAERKVKEAREKIRMAEDKLGFVSDRTLALNFGTLVDLDMKLGLLEGRLWLHRHIGSDDPRAGSGEKGIEMPDLSRDSDDNSHYNSSTGTVTIIPEHIGIDSVLFHELDHHFLEAKMGTVSPGGPHSIEEDLSERVDANGTKLGPIRGSWLAFSEGWADFSAAAKKGSSEICITGTGIVVTEDLEPFEHEEGGLRHHGPTVEGTTAGVLWDLFDGPANGVAEGEDPPDGVSIEFKLIWKALCRLPKSSTIGRFHTNLQKVLEENEVPQEKRDAVRELFEKHRAIESGG